MKQKHKVLIVRIFVIILALTMLMSLLVSCSSDGPRLDDKGELYQSFLPEREAEMGVFFAIDTFNKIKIERVERVGEQGVVITYDWLNERTAPSTLNDNVSLTVKQGGVTLRPDLSLVADRSLLVQQAAAGAALEGLQQGFILDNDLEPLEFFWLGQAMFVFVDGVPQDAYPVQVSVDLDS